MTSTEAGIEPGAPAPAVAEELAPAVAAAIATVRRNAAAFDGRYPDDTTRDGRYPARPATERFAEGANRGWTTSFVPGMQWLAHEHTGEPDLLVAARQHADDFVRRVRADEDLDTHDLGFLYTLSCVNAWRLTGDGAAKEAALVAADRLASRFLEPAGIVQAWGDLADPAQRGRTIIDSLMNMPLLTWAADVTGDARFGDVVARHTAQLREHMLRPDDSTFHTFYWDAETGEPLRGGTEQGAGDHSAWARGQAWGIYGFALDHRAWGRDASLRAAERCADYFLAHLPADNVAYWDLVYGDGSEAPRDSSAAAIAVCGLLELASLDPDDAAGAERRYRYAAAALDILRSLVSRYTPSPDGGSDALLLHAVYDAPKNIGVDEGCLWGDYFYLEALTRCTVPGWRSPWWRHADDGGASARGHAS